MKTYSVEISRRKISVWDNEGEGLPVLFLHANSVCKETFLQQMESPLAQKYHFIALDLPGHGKSDRAKDPVKTYTFEGYADVVLEVINRLQLDKLVVVGWSLGGHVALCLLRKTPKIVGLLITGTPPIPVSLEGFQMGFNPMPERLHELFVQKKFTREEAEEFLAPCGMDTKKYPFIVEAAFKMDGSARPHLFQSILQGVGGDQRELVEKSETPLCIIAGQEDPLINQHYLTKEVNYRNLFQGKVHFIEKSGHAPFAENPDAFNHILENFLSYVSHRGKG